MLHIEHNYIVDIIMLSNTTNFNKIWQKNYRSASSVAHNTSTIAVPKCQSEKFQCKNYDTALSILTLSLPPSPLL